MSTERRLHANHLPPEGGEVRLASEAARHAGVLRLRPGDGVMLFDGKGGSADAVLLATDKTGLLLRAGPRRIDVSGRTGVTLVQCLTRGGKLDDLVRAATELGVDEVRLARSEYAVGRAEDERWEKRRDRLDRVVLEAARQSERDLLPVLAAPASLVEHCAGLPATTLKLAFCGRSGEPLARLDPESAVVLVVGPEGGLSGADLAALDELGFRRVSLGSTVLRVETAVVAAIAAVFQARRDGAPVHPGDSNR